MVSAFIDLWPPFVWSHVPCAKPRTFLHSAKGGIIWALDGQHDLIRLPGFFTTVNKLDSTHDDDESHLYGPLLGLLYRRQRSKPPFKYAGHFGSMVAYHHFGLIVFNGGLDGLLFA